MSIHQLSRDQRKELAKSVSFAHFKITHQDSTGCNLTQSFATVAVSHLGPAVYAGIAYCSPKDNFCRSKGRFTALRKLFGGNGGSTFTILEDPTMRPFELARNILEDILPTVEKVPHLSIGQKKIVEPVSTPKRRRK